MRIRLAVIGAVAGGIALTAAAVADGSFALSYENARIVGAVLTKFHARAHGYGYGYGYGYEPYRYGGVGSREREIKLIAQREE